MAISCKKKKIEKKSALAAKSARSAAKDAGSLVSEGASDLTKRAAEFFGQAQDWAEPRVKDALDSGKDAYAKARKETVKFAAPKIEHATEAVRPRVDHAYEAISEDYLPRIQKAMHDAAKAAQSGKTLDKKAKKAGKAARKALTTKTKKNTAAKTFGWILVGSVAAGAGYLLWRRTQPIEDPWAEEYWNEAEATSARAVPQHKESPLVEKAKEAAENVKEGAKKAADAVATKAEDMKDKAEDLKDKVTGTGEAAGATGVGAQGNVKVDKDVAKDLKDAKPAGSVSTTPTDEKIGEVRKDLKDASKDIKEAADKAKASADKKIDDLKK